MLNQKCLDCFRGPYHAILTGMNNPTDVSLEPGPVPPIEELAVRITRLERAFRRRASRLVGLSVDVVGCVPGSDDLVHPVAGFTVRLDPPAEGSGASGASAADAGVSLYVNAEYGELTRWRAPGMPAAGALRERFRVSLFDEYGWGESSFPDADALAHDLIGYMLFNLDAVA
jgi:hypothetical protein